MRIRLLAVGKGMPTWVAQGFTEYARRLPRQCALELVEVAAARRPRASARTESWREQEGGRLLAATPAGSHTVALDEGGVQWSTVELAARLERWMGEGTSVTLLVGGADGLAENCLARARYRWSLSALTLPHMLVRVIVAEQIYRAWSILSGHPYHRGQVPGA